jgi:hypothetical protein
MRKRLALYSFTVGLAAALSSYAIGQTPAVLYYCGTADRIYLWADARDPAAIATGNGSYWSPTPQPSPPLWHRIRGLVSSGQNDAPEKRIAALCREQPSDARFQPRYPDVEIYIRRASEVPEVTFLGAGAITTFKLTAADANSRRKAPNVPLGKLLRARSDKDAAAVLSGKQFDDPASFLTDWVKDIKQSSEPFQTVYTSSDGAPVWLWAEALDDAAWSSRIRRPMTPRSASLGEREKLVPVPTINWLATVLSLFAGLAGGVFVSRLRKPAAKPAPAYTGSGEAPANGLPAADASADRMDRNFAALAQHLDAKLEQIRSLFASVAPASTVRIDVQDNISKLVLAAYTFAARFGNSASPLAPLAPGGEMEEWLRSLPAALQAMDESIQREIAAAAQNAESARQWATKFQQCEIELQAAAQALEASRGEVLALRNARSTEDRTVHEWTVLHDLISPVRTGQTNYLDGYKDVPASAMLAFLISYSMLNVAVAVSGSDEALSRAMKANLTAICRKLAACKLPGFQNALDRIEKGRWNMESLPDKLVRQDDHRDAGIFQVVLKHLRDHNKLDFAPFYFDVDEHGLAFRAN